ncbi:uncharacterized protein BDR25DRAFT_356088 [Lindgomyces ingoldianus]|uniref:Uncharacterized protein n=1 Tax=Lindgomyces ingoldianus TaxID=673940 RepID=A0ACB6QSI9_9PLEO|nr:uncharacterized protein BDR25DRAFT_356088 [Lindgomyces ingoldianus]KAF2469845.1 hypothetical protein BDR25DRAFT_356088 [Lindgomyces ingoldianus]
MAEISVLLTLSLILGCGLIDKANPSGVASDMTPYLFDKGLLDVETDHEADRIEGLLYLVNISWNLVSGNLDEPEHDYGVVGAYWAHTAPIALPEIAGNPPVEDSMTPPPCSDARARGHSCEPIAPARPPPSVHQAALNTILPTLLDQSDIPNTNPAELVEECLLCFEVYRYLNGEYPSHHHNFRRIEDVCKLALAGGEMSANEIEGHRGYGQPAMNGQGQILALNFSPLAGVDEMSGIIIVDGTVEELRHRIFAVDGPPKLPAPAHSKVDSAKLNTFDANDPQAESQRGTVGEVGKMNSSSKRKKRYRQSGFETTPSALSVVTFGHVAALREDR